MAISKVISLIGELIALPSVSSVSPAFDQSNRAVIDRLANWLADLGCRVEVLPLPNNPDKANLIAVLGEGSEGLVLSGHTDTVPFDEGRWHYDPFRLTETHQRLYGLGTADMKSFFALALEAARGFHVKDLKRPLTILATADEESSMDGARALVASGRRLGRYAVIGEPTGLQPVRMHKGILMEAIRLRGRSGHSSDPSLGVSALEGMHRVIAEILKWREELQQQHHNPAFKVDVPTLNLGRIHGGDNPNRICAECELHIDLRLLPGMDPGDLRRALRARIEQSIAGRDLTLELASLFPGIPPLETDAAATIVCAAERLTGRTAGAVAFGTEAPYLTELGMETVILGPGNIEQAHQPDEYLSLDYLQPTVDLLTHLIRDFCVEPV